MSEPPLLTLTPTAVPPEDTVIAPPANTVSLVPTTADDVPPAGQLTTVVAPIPARFNVAPTPLTVPPLTASVAPALRVTLVSVAPDTTLTVPPALT